MSEQLTRPSSRLGAESPSVPTDVQQRRPRPCGSPAPLRTTPSPSCPPHTAAVPISTSARAGPYMAHASAAAEAAEIKRILQGMLSTTQHDTIAADSPRKTFLGVSPPTRSMGVANPLVQDALWQRDSYHATHCNLQALREIDAACGISFLRTDHRGDWRLLIGSPEHTTLADAVEEDDVVADAHVVRGAMPPPPGPHAMMAARPPSAQERTSPSSCTTAAAFL